MILCDFEITQAVIQREVSIEPWDPDMVQPASLDMRLDRYWRWYPKTGEPIDPASPERRTKEVEHDCYHLGPQQFVLASTMERVKFPAHMVGRIEGKSSLARMGIFIHVTAGFIDPGFEGWVTLEIFNGNPNPVILRAGMPVCQMSFHRLGRAASKPYGSDAVHSKYQDQPRGPQESAYYKNFESEVPA